MHTGNSVVQILISLLIFKLGIGSCVTHTWVKNRTKLLWNRQSCRHANRITNNDSESSDDSSNESQSPDSDHTDNMDAHDMDGTEPLN